MVVVISIFVVVFHWKWQWVHADHVLWKLICEEFWHIVLWAMISAVAGISTEAEIIYKGFALPIIRTHLHLCAFGFCGRCTYHPKTSNFWSMCIFGPYIHVQNQISSARTLDAQISTSVTRSSWMSIRNHRRSFNTHIRRGWKYRWLSLCKVIRKPIPKPHSSLLYWKFSKFLKPIVCFYLWMIMFDTPSYGKDTEEIK